MARQTVRKAPLAPVLILGLLMSSAAAFAADPPSATKTRPIKRDAALAASEARVTELQQRIEELERRVQAVSDATAAARPIAATQATQANPPPRTAAARAPAASSVSVTQSTNPTAPRRAAPGTFEVDEAAAQRALERTLTQSGALLLPPGVIELTPGFSYSRLEQSTPSLGTVVNGGVTSVVLARERTESNEITPRLDLRVGLPMNAQLEVGLPYNYVRSKRVSDFGAESSDNGNGIGDLTLGFAKTLMREKGVRPDLIGRVNYNFGNGKQSDGPVNLGSGFRQLQAEVVALKRQDPLAFTASASYTKVFEEDAIKPGDAAIFALGAVLAASPATSLQLSFAQIYRQKQEFNGSKLAGTDQTYGIINLGTSSVLSRDMTLVTQFGIGLGDDAPKYSFSIALPILFR